MNTNANAQPHNPHNSMIPVAITTPHGGQHGMTRIEAEHVIERPFNPRDWLEVLNMASASYILGFDATALELAEQAVALNPLVAAGWINLAVIHGSRGRFIDASHAAEEAYAADPTNRVAATIYAESLLRLGKWREAWPLFHNYYDSNRVSLFRFAIPEWTGQRLKGKRLLVIEGGGFGDNFFFLRWLRELKSLGAHITYLCPASMCKLMESQSYIDRTLPTSQGSTNEIRPAEFDYFVPLLSLGHKLNKTPQNSWNSPYIGSTGGDELNRDRPTRVGFCWQAAESCLPRPFRSLDHSQQVQLTSLLKAQGTEVQSLVPNDWERDLGWDTTARLIRSCDLIISVDTGVAHLAAAMDRPTWVILPGFSAWYYGVNSLTSPLYPTMRLFRNHVRGIDVALAACCRALEAQHAHA